MTTYENYCKIRDSKGLKDSNISSMTGIAKSTFSDWKAGRSQPKANKLSKIATCLEVSVECLLGSENYQIDNETHTWDFVIDNKDMKILVEAMSDKDNADRLIAYAKKLIELKNMEDMG